MLLVRDKYVIYDNVREIRFKGMIGLRLHENLVFPGLH